MFQLSSRLSSLFFSLNILPILLGLMLSSCGNHSKTNSINSNNTDLLLNCWKHSREEDPADRTYQVYRPCDSMEFPRSRFRGRLSFQENKSCEYRVLSPTDAHYNATGAWEYDSDKQIVFIKNEENEVVVEYQILELTDKMLKLKPKSN